MRYRDLPAELTRHTWFLLLYAVGIFALIYVSGQFTTPLLLFVTAEIPVLIMAAFVIRPNPHLAIRLPIFWLVTGAVVTGLVIGAQVPLPGTAGSTAAANSWLGASPGNAHLLVAMGIWALVVYWVVTAVLGLAATRGDLTQPRIIGDWMATIGATGVALSLLLSLIAWSLGELLGQSMPGSVLVKLGTIWIAVLPVRMLLFALVVLGLLLNAAARFTDNPYAPPTPDEVMPVHGSGLVDIIYLVVRWPLWILVVIAGFLVAFMSNFLNASKDILERWAAQAYYGIASLLGAPLALAAGHWLAWSAVLLTIRHLQGENSGLVEDVLTFLVVHLAALLALSIYAASPALVGMRWRDGILVQDLVADTIEGFSSTGRPAAVSVGRAFSMLGIVIVAAPLAAVLPGGSGVGLFSLFYITILIVSTPYLRAKAVAGSRNISLATLVWRRK